MHYELQTVKNILIFQNVILYMKKDGIYRKRLLMTNDLSFGYQVAFYLIIVTFGATGVFIF